MKPKEITFRGRGGQGTVIASILAAKALLTEGKKAITMPEFGVERRGAPVKAYLYIGTTTPRYAIYRPDCVVVLDDALVGPDIVSGLKNGGTIIINSAKRPEDFFHLGPFNIGVVNAVQIARKHKIGTKTNPIINTAMLGAIAKLLNIFTLEGLVQAIANSTDIPTKKINDNIAAAKEAFDQAVVKKSNACESPKMPTANTTDPQRFGKDFLQLTKEISISFKDTTENKTGSWCLDAPVIDQNKCKNRGRKCGLCDVCPDQAIIIDRESGLVSIDYDYCKGCGLCINTCPIGAIIRTSEIEAEEKHEE